MRKNPTALLASLLLAACAASGLQTYEGPPQPEQEAIVSIPGASAGGRLTLLAMDHVAANSLAGIKAWGKIDSLRVLPGSHTFGFHWVTEGTVGRRQTDFKLCLYAKSGHRYAVKTAVDGYELQTWLEDEQTGQRVGGISGCDVADQDKPELPAVPVRQSIHGASFVPPPASGLRVEDQGAQRFVAYKADERAGDFVELRVTSSVLPRFADTEDFVRQVRQAEDERLERRYKVMSHQVQAGSWGGAVCARSYWIGADHQAAVPKGEKGPLIVESMALTCAHPDDRRVGVTVTYAHEHPPGKEDPDFASKAAGVAESLQFEKL